MMTSSQNGWPVLTSDSPKLHTWVLPTHNGPISLPLRNGSAGFVMCHYALWHDERIEKLIGKIRDDWGWAPRNIVGSTEISNHASGTAMDLNATTHVLGAHDTYTNRQEEMIHRRLNWFRGVIRWGGDYQHRKDEMHFEIVQTLKVVEWRARHLMDTPRGKRILEANPGQRKVILS